MMNKGKIKRIVWLTLIFFLLKSKASSHVVECNSSAGCNGSIWVQLESGFWTWLNTQCSNIFNSTEFRNLVRCLLQRATGNQSANAHCRCKESPYDCTLSEPYNPRNLLTNNFTLPIPGKGDIIITELAVTNWTINNLTCSISVVDGTQSCPGYYPMFTDYIQIEGNIQITAHIRIRANQTGVGGGANDIYLADAVVTAAPFRAGINFFIRHVENFLAPSLQACVGPTLQDIGVSVAYFFLGNPAGIGIRWTQLPTNRTLAQFVAFLQAQLRYQAFNQDLIGGAGTLPAGQRPYIGPASVFDLMDFMGTDIVSVSPSTTRPCRGGGKFGWLLGGTIYYDVGIETAFCAVPGPGVQIRGAIDVELDYDDIPGVGDPGTRGCACPSVSGSSSSPCGGAHMCAAIHCSFFQRLFCLLINERVLDFEDPPGSGIPVSKNTQGLGSVLGLLGTCEQWRMLIPGIKQFCPDGSGKLMGIRAIPTNCGSVQCGGNVQRPAGGTLVNYPTDIAATVDYDFEFWIRDGVWRRLFSFNPLRLTIGLNLAWWYCTGAPCSTQSRVLYFGLVIDPDILGVQQDSTHPQFPPGGNWNSIVADIVGVILSGNLFGGLYWGNRLIPVILDSEGLLANPPNLDPVPHATYTRGSFGEPDLNSSFDVNSNFLRMRFGITGALTGRWFTDFVDRQIGVSPPLGRATIETEIENLSKPTWEGVEVSAKATGAKDPVFYYSVNGGAWRISLSPKMRFGPFPEGYHSIKIFAADRETKVFDPTPVTIEFLIDSIGPQINTNIEEVIPPKFEVFVKTYDTFTPEEEIEISYSIDDGEFYPWTKDKRFSLRLEPGIHKIVIKAKDKSGNESVWSKKFYVGTIENFGCSSYK